MISLQSDRLVTSSRTSCTFQEEYTSRKSSALLGGSGAKVDASGAEDRCNDRGVRGGDNRAKDGGDSEVVEVGRGGGDGASATQSRESGTTREPDTMVQQAGLVLGVPLRIGVWTW